MNLRFVYQSILVCLILLVTSCSKSYDNNYIRNENFYKIGDQQEWASIDYDDRDWQKNITILDGQVSWARTNIEILETPEKFRPYGINFHHYGEYEVYWDGVLIGRNGNPGQEATLAPSGQMWASFYIPEDLTKKGKHVLALKRSFLHFPDHSGRFSFNLDYYDNLHTYWLKYTSFMHIFAGAFLIGSLYFFFLYLGEKKNYSMLIFSTICFLFFALIIMEFVKFYVPIHYSKHHVRLEIIAFLTFFLAILVPLYFTIQFQFPKHKYILLSYLAVLFFVFFRDHDAYDNTAFNMAVTMWILSTGIVSFGVYKKIKGASIVLLTLLICALINTFTFYDTGLFVGFGVIVLGMFYILAINTKEQRLAYENSLVQSTRLRLELLKKNIQPHFLMNSLTSLIDWVEESPSKGISFIEALAKEFDLLNQIESESLIPITQEIELCRTHLEIMKFRKEVDYLWDEEGILSNERIPPATLHTLVENGITHCSPLDDNTIRFKLIFENNEQFKSYTFLTFAKVRHKTKVNSDGTGLKYVKARLEESYGKMWSFSSTATEQGWKNIIKIYN